MSMFRIFGLLVGVAAIGALVYAEGAHAAGPAPGPAPGGAPAGTPAADATRLAQDNARFAFDLYHKLRGQEGNLLISPHSVSQALAMTYAGARGRTQQQMAGVMHFDLGRDRLHAAFHGLDEHLMTGGRRVQGKEQNGVQLHIANALWAQQGVRFLSAYQRLVADHYRGGLNLVDFSGDAEGSRATINQWVSEQTEGKITDLFPSGTIQPDTRLVLTNAVYFNADWQRQFDPKATHQGDFHLLAGGQVRVPLMAQTAPFGHAQGEGYVAVQLPYDGAGLAMLLLVPDRGAFQEFERGLKADALMLHLRQARVQLSMPKFEYSSKFELNDPLIALGMRDAFVGGVADFSGMTDQERLNIDTVVHEAYILVDEKGTEAAAATGVGMAITSVPPPPVVLTIDRPFLFFIRDIKTGTLLFMGRVVDPST